MAEQGLAVRRVALCAWALAAWLAGPLAWAQPGGVAGAECRASLNAAQSQKLQQCEAHGHCRNVARVFDTCPTLKAWLGRLAANGAKVDDSVLRRALVEAGVPAPGLASCTTAFSRSLCRQFLSVEDLAGAQPVAPVLARDQQLQADARRVIEQQERARLPADAHRFAELKLNMCGLARQRIERDLQCQEAVEAVSACESFREDWKRRRDAVAAEAERQGHEPLLRQLMALEMPPCAQTLPQNGLTPAQALAMPAVEEKAPEAAASAPAAAAASPGGASGAGPTSSTRPASPTTRYGTECKSALQRLEEHLETVRRRRPPRADNMAVTQVNLYMLKEQIDLLGALCRGQREHDFLRPMQDSFDRSLQSCRENAADAALCVPRLAW